MNELAEHLLEAHLGDHDAVVVAQEGQITDLPEEWVLEKVVYCNGKRIRTYRIQS